jgi:hypothetical protein
VHADKGASSQAESEHPMNGASKILTVSYGTFSCTLEGFDDPFNTMKAIAEYFRDLAAEDRYFGAEPPQPDAAMLHKIAEREIQRRVEAKIQENGVILRADSEAEPARQPAPRLERAPEPRASDVAPVAPSATAAPVAPVAPAAAQQEAPAPRITMPAAEAARPAPAAAPSLAAEGAVTSSVAEKLLRLRQAAAASATTAATLTVVPKVAPEEDSYIEDQHAEPAQMPAPAAAFDDAEDLLPEDMPALQSTEGEDLLPEDTAETVPEDAPLAATEVAAVEAEATEAEEAQEPAAPEAEAVAMAEAVEAEIAVEVAEEPATLEAVVEAAPEAVAEAVAEAAAEEPAASEDLAVASSPAAQDDDSLIASLGELLDPEADDDLLEEAAAPTASAEVTADLDSIKAALASMDVAPAAAPSAPDLMDLEDADENTGATVTDQATTVLAEEMAEPAEEPDTAGIDEEIVIEVEISAEDEAPVGVASVEVAIEAEVETAEPAEAEAEAEVQADAPAAASTPEAQKPAPEMEDVMARIAAPVRPVRPVRPQRTGNAEQERPTMLPLAETRAAPPAPAATVPAEPITLEKLQRARARVIRIRHRDEDGPADQPAAAARPSGEASLSAEAQAALEAELAALRAEDDDQDHSAKAESQTRLPPAGDEAVTRLIAEAATQMDVPDARRRLSAIAHLKAAVAATLADRKSSETRSQAAEADRMTAYRDDLARVVRPVTAPAPTERPTQAERPVQADRPAPLVLVSEQRIDRPRVAQAVAGSGPTLVGRSSMQTASALQAQAYDDEDEADLEDDSANIFDGATSFRDFAERLGAQELPDMLEAAAAYIACVEGRESFTRPQLMQHLASVATDVAREDSLRSFGILLREGRIEKSRRGLFALNAESHILAEAKKIAG